MNKIILDDEKCREENKPLFQERVTEMEEFFIGRFLNLSESLSSLENDL